MTNQNNNNKIDQYKFARQELEKERAHRRDKLWKIFSWAGTLLIAIIGGTITLKTDPPSDFTFSWCLRSVLIATVILLTLYAILWITQNQKIEKSVQEALDNYDQKLGIEWEMLKTSPKFGYRGSLLMLAIAAIIAIVVEV